MAQRFLGVVLLLGLVAATAVNVVYRFTEEEPEQRPIQVRERGDLTHIIETSGRTVARRYLFYVTLGELLSHEGVLVTPPESRVRDPDAYALGRFRVSEEDYDATISAEHAATLAGLPSVEVPWWYEGRREAPHIIVLPEGQEADRFRLLRHRGTFYVVEDARLVDLGIAVDR